MLIVLSVEADSFIGGRLTCIIADWSKRQAWCSDVFPSLSGLFRSIFSMSCKVPTTKHSSDKTQR